MRWLVALCLLAAAPAAAQTPGAASFRVYQRGALVGGVEMSLQASDTGWRLQGTSRIDGSVPVDIPNLDLHYDEEWRPVFMTVEMTQPDQAIVHVAVIGSRTRTDVVRSTEARFRSHSISPDAVFLPDRAYGAYEWIAVRLDAGVPGQDLAIFIAPIGETRARIDEVAPSPVSTTNGPVMATRYSLTEIRQRPTPVEIWVENGRLLRLELPREGISMVREDVVR